MIDLTSFITLAATARTRSNSAANARQASLHGVARLGTGVLPPKPIGHAWADHPVNYWHPA